MDVGSIFLILALVLVVALFVGRPFLQSRSVPLQSEAADRAEHRRSTLLADRDRLLTSLQELDFDYRLGKIPGEDYPVMRSSLMQNAAKVMRQLDEIQGVGKSPDSAEDLIEQVIAARRADAAVIRSNGGAAAKPAPSPEATGVGQDDIEDLLASRKRERQEKSAGFCPKCGKPAQKSDRFCSRCGTTL